ncbi:MAG: hypothetical protein ACXWP1_00185 [Bdellovibrionota bacterium]
MGRRNYTTGRSDGAGWNTVECALFSRLLERKAEYQLEDLGNIIVEVLCTVADD